MSADTKAVVDAAIAAHVADEMPGYFVPASFTVYAAQDIDGHVTNYNTIIPTGQAFHTSLGLSEAGTKLLDDYWEEG